MRISDWSSDVCSSDLALDQRVAVPAQLVQLQPDRQDAAVAERQQGQLTRPRQLQLLLGDRATQGGDLRLHLRALPVRPDRTQIAQDLAGGDLLAETGQAPFRRLEDRKSTRLNSRP